MKLGVFDPLFGALELEPMLDKLVSLGLEAVEVGSGGYVGKSPPRCSPTGPRWIRLRTPLSVAP